jgi:hypothetical protein
MGDAASTGIELANVLQTVEIESVEFHLYRRDFERWVRDVFRYITLANMIFSLRKEGLKGEELRKGLIVVIKDCYKYSVEPDR